VNVSNKNKYGLATCLITYFWHSTKNAENTVSVVSVIFPNAHALRILGNFVACDQMHHICDSL